MTDRRSHVVLLWTLGFLSALVCSPALAGNLPPGPYQVNTPPLPFGTGCQSIKMDHGTLSATCLNYFQTWEQTSLTDADKCVADKHVIENINGSLRCVISSVPVRALSDPRFYVGDIVSIVSDEVTAAGEIKVFRIDQPRVDIQTDPFPAITFKPGDSIILNAGGCAQSGGGGATWKSYIGVAQSDAPYYEGTVSVPGTIPLGPIAGAISRTWRVAPPPKLEHAKESFLTLGYLDDDYSDNGYYQHDNGNSNQCANVGPAWVEVKIISGSVKKGVVWSSDSKLPFDLVWDENNEDFNGLPLNPEWSYQLRHPGSTPNFAAACGQVFGSGDGFNPKTLAAICSSQSPTADLDTSFFRGAFGYCSGMIDGHLNWYVATYTGTVMWQEFSGWWPNDGDYNLLLSRADKAGQTADEVALQLEFDGGETIAHAGGPWWQSLGVAGPDSLVLTGSTAAWSMFGGNAGLPAVVTGLVGIDGVHGSGATELHPVFAIAINTQLVQTANSVRETWVFFLRNSGDEGNCSEQTHTWISPANNEYVIQLPWPALAASVKVAGDSEWWAWQDGATKGSILRSADPGWTLIKVQFPPGVFGGVDGQFTLEYSMPTGQVPVPPKREGRRTVKKEHEPQLRDLIAQIKDRSVASSLTNDLMAFKPAPIAIKKVRVSFDTSLTVEPRKPGAASRGEGTRTRDVRDSNKEKLNASIKAVLDKHAPQMQLASAAPATGVTTSETSAALANQPASSVASMTASSAAATAAASPLSGAAPIAGTAAAATGAVASSSASPALVNSQPNATGGLACTYRLGSATFVRNTKKAACPSTAAPTAGAASAAATTGAVTPAAAAAASAGSAPLVSSQPNAGGGLACTYQEGSTTFTRNTKKVACPPTSTAPSSVKSTPSTPASTTAATATGGSATLVSSRPNTSGGLACTYQEGRMSFTRNTKKAACPPTSTAPTGSVTQASKGKAPSPATAAPGEAVLIKTEEVQGKLECTYRRGNTTFTRATQKSQCLATEK